MDLTLIEAWNLWWSGEQINNHSIHGISVLWASRIGKLLAFLAGTTIVLDLIGSDRLIAWGNRSGKSPLLALATMVLLLVGAIVLTETLRPGEWLLANYHPWVLLVVIALLSPVAWWSLNRLPTFSVELVVRFGQLIANPRFERWLRAVAVPLFFLGFALDYLAS